MLNQSPPPPLHTFPSSLSLAFPAESPSPSNALLTQQAPPFSPRRPQMDASSDHQSPRRPMQGPRPPRLHVSKDSHTIKKPAAAASQAQARHHPALQQQAAAPPPRAPVIIYDASPKIIHTKPSEFMALVQRLTGPGPAGPLPAQPEEPAPAQFQPQELLLSPTAALSPAARLAAIERSVRPMPPSAPAQYAEAGDEGGDNGLAGFLGPPRYGILSPLPAALPPAVSSGLFSPLPFDPSCMGWLNELSPILRAASTAGVGDSGGARPGYYDPFVPSPRTLLATPTVPSPTCMEFFGSFLDL